MMQEPGLTPSRRPSPFAAPPQSGLAATPFEIGGAQLQDALAEPVDRWPSVTLGPSVMSTAASDALRPLAPDPDSAAARRAEALAAIFSDFYRQHPDGSIVALIAADMGRLLRRQAVVAAPTMAGCLLGFLAGMGLSTEAGFNLLVPVPSQPFNPHGAEHRGEAAALVGWSLSAGIALAIGLGRGGWAAGRAARLLLGGGGDRPASPLADLLVAEMGRLYRRHQAVAACTLAMTLACYLLPLGICNQAGFNFLRNIPSPPFNPTGIADRGRAGWLLGWSATIAILVGAPIGAALGVRLGRGLRALQRQPGPRGA